MFQSTSAVYSELLMPLTCAAPFQSCVHDHHWAVKVMLLHCLVQLAPFVNMSTWLNASVGQAGNCLARSHSERLEGIPLEALKNM